MGMQVETGLIVADANSYVTVAELQAYATDRGITVPEQPEACESLLIRATDFLEGLRYIGRRTDPAVQSLRWPRACAWYEGALLPDNTIPKQIKSAQCELCFAAQILGPDLFPIFSANAKGIVASESVFGAVSRTYFQNTTGPVPYIGALRGLLWGLATNVGGIASANAVRA